MEAGEVHPQRAQATARDVVRACRRWRCLHAALLVVLLAPVGTRAESTASRAEDWLGRRGIEVDPSLVVEGVVARDGDGRLGSAGLGLAAVGANVDTARAGLWRGGIFAVALHGAFGRRPSDFVGDFQGTSNIEASERIRLYEAWYRHRWRGDRLRLTAGVHDYNSAFNVLGQAALFVNSSFGLTPELAQVEPSIFPRTSFGVRLRHHGTNGVYVLAGAYDAQAGDRIAEQFRVRRSEGVFWAAEAGFVRERDRLKAAVGAWYGDRDFNDFGGTPREKNSGYYAIAQRRFAVGSSARTLAPFVQVGRAREDRNQIGSYLGAGVQAAGWVPGRPDDRIGLAWAQAHNGSRFLELFDRAAHETVFELTYLVQVTPWLQIQPDVQIVVHPGTSASASTARVFTVRVALALP